MPLNSDVPYRWQRFPHLNRSREVCVFVSYAPNGMMPEHSQVHARAWHDAGFSVVIVLNSDTFADEMRLDGLEFASGILVRENRGYDFGAWASALHEMPRIRSASLVALANDSMYGPLDTFEPMLDRARATEGDVIGAIESWEFGRHFQSFLLFFKARALNSPAFWRFWSSVRAGGRITAVYRYELNLMPTLERAGLRCKALFKSGDRRNPTLTRWRALIDEGLPYLKVALLRDNPFKVDIAGWEDVLHKHNYDPALAKRHLSRTSGSYVP